MPSEFAAEPGPATSRAAPTRPFDRLLQPLVLTMGSVLTIAGIWAWPRDPVRDAPASGLSLHPLNQELGPVPVGELQKVHFQAINRDASRPARVLGIEQHCDEDGCIFWRGDVTTIPPGQSATFEVEWKANRPGKLVQRIPVYTDRPGQSELDLTISGDAFPNDGDATSTRH